MYKMLNIFFLLVVFIFFFCIYKYYSSNINFKVKEFNRINIDNIIKDKISNLPVLSNDTDDVIEFNNSISEGIKGNKPRSFWNLLKPK